MFSKKHSRKNVKSYVVYLGLFLYGCFLLFPIYFALVTSIKPNLELYSKEYNPLWVLKPTLDHFIYLFEKTSFLMWAKNSFIVAVFSTAISITIGAVAGYAIARLRYRGSQPMAAVIFITYLVPTSLLFLPMANLVRELGLFDRQIALIIVYPTFLIPFCTLLMTGYFRSIPKELEECATVDGATRIQAFWKIALPLSLPGLVSAGLFAFTMSWDEFLYALVLTQSSSVKTLTVGVVSQLHLADVYFWGSLMAAALLGSIPIVIIYSFFLEYYVKGLTAGAVKG